MTGSRRQSGVVVAWQWEQDFCFAAASTGLRPEGIVGVLPDDEGEGVGEGEIGACIARCIRSRAKSGFTSNVSVKEDSPRLSHVGDSYVAPEIGAH